VTPPEHFTRFSGDTIATGDGSVFVRWGGNGPPVLLLHGFPETHLMWRAVAPMLARAFTVVCPDLPGYGASRVRVDRSDAHTKRAMAGSLVHVMQALGHQRFSVVGHDRGGRVAYRLALDHPDVCKRLAVLDVIPTCDALDRADDRFALAYWPWSLLAQPAPLPERVLVATADAIVDHAHTHWGAGAAIPPDVREAYVDALRNPDVARSVCHEYRAAVTLDIADDQVDRQAGRGIRSPTLVLWAAEGPLDTWYIEEGGPLAIWRRWAADVGGTAVSGGHFFPEQRPADTADYLREFLGADLEQSG
jgi:haloacetate dehalogenase